MAELGLAAVAVGPLDPGHDRGQNRTRSSRHATRGRPGEGACPQYARTCSCRSRTRIHRPTIRCRFDRLKMACDPRSL